MSGVTRETTVMIVDDVPENLSLLSAILQKENYHVEVYHSSGYYDAGNGRLPGLSITQIR
jgi:CheY-like chemotaxis protein